MFYADVENLKSCTKSDETLTNSLSVLAKAASEFLSESYIKSDYDYHKLQDGEVCIGIFVTEPSSKTDIKEAFLQQFKTDPVKLHFMMIQKHETKYYVYDSNVGPNIPITIESGKVSSTTTYIYSGLAIVLSTKKEK